MFISGRVLLPRIERNGLRQWYISRMPRGIMGLVGVSTASHPSRTANVPEVRLDSLLLSVTSKPPNTGYSDPITSAKFFLMFSQAKYDVKNP